MASFSDCAQSSRSEKFQLFVIFGWTCECSVRLHSNIYIIVNLIFSSQHMHTQKLHYISQNPGAGSANLTVANSVYSLIGTPPAWRRHSRLCWKQGVCHLIEDIVTPQTVSTIYALGPHYMGSLQAPHLGKQSEPLNPLVPEERVMFGLNAKAMSHLTLAKIRKVYSRSDNKAIAKQLGMSSHENATPIR